MSLNLIAFILSVIGLKAAFNMRTATGEPHLYSLHSWIGFLTVLFFAGQFAYGFIVYLLPGVPLWLRSASMPIHRACGKAIFLMSLVAIATGLMTKASMVLPNYSELSAEAYVVNFIALFLVVFSGIALYLVNAPEYKRVPLSSD
ncbi:cytochrome b561-related [Holotrichia oblita]|uniref:Cytochrome b561-related n=1 Tax=Holotrichia oblita TaxID=644536 RepID=A0ACB9SHF6_HOLOL|nr:cytochrome b561-related [Holotrichia oblita]